VLSVLISFIASGDTEDWYAGSGIDGRRGSVDSHQWRPRHYFL
jgi:hypothetical protein